jgi:hypothetical protein
MIAAAQGPASPPSPYLTSAEAAAYLRYRSASAIRNLRRGDHAHHPAAAQMRLLVLVQ